MVALIACGDDDKQKYGDFYKRSMMLDPSGWFKFDGRRYNVQWDCRPYEINGTMQLKIAKESIATLRAATKGSRAIPIGVIGSALDGFDAVCTEVVRMAESPLETIDHEGVYLYTMRPSFTGVQISGKFYKPFWIRSPVEQDQTILKNMLENSVETAYTFFRKFKVRPSVIVTNALAGHNSSYSQAY